MKLKSPHAPGQFKSHRKLIFMLQSSLIPFPRAPLRDKETGDKLLISMRESIKQIVLIVVTCCGDFKP